MSDYRLELKVKNAPMYNAMLAAGYETVAALSRDCGVCQAQIGEYMNLKRPMLNKSGRPSPVLLRIEKALRRPYTDLFPADYSPIKTNSFVAELTSNQMEAITSQSEDPLQTLIESEANFDQMISKVSDRQKQVLRLRYSEEMTYKEIGNEMGVSMERARQIENSALRKLRHPSNREGVLNNCGMEWNKA